jgi:hypothetical protein
MDRLYHCRVARNIIPYCVVLHVRALPKLKKKSPEDCIEVKSWASESTIKET